MNVTVACWHHTSEEADLCRHCHGTEVRLVPVDSIRTEPTVLEVPDVVLRHTTRREEK